MKLAGEQLFSIIPPEPVAADSFDDDRNEYDLLREQSERTRDAWKRAKDAGDEEVAAVLKAEGAVLRRRLAAIEAERRFMSVCPVEWVRDASDADIEGKITHPGLRTFAAREDAPTCSALLLGPTGIGKSAAAGLALRRAFVGGRVSVGGLALERGGLRSLPAALWQYARALAHAARMHPLGQGECEAITNARGASLLILDDLGLERDPAEIVDVVHERYERNRPTWTTSGLTLPQLTERYGEAFVRRLGQVGGRPALVVNAFPREAK
jgi:DNA replication protein DnaC